MILVDSNVPMYLVGGAQQPHKADAHRLLDDLVAREERLATNVELLQEILHRYTAIGRPDAIQPAFDALLNIVDEAFPIRLEELESAKGVLLGGYGLSARDAIHVAVMQTHDIRRILSFDSGFDRFPGLERIS